jgi:hypothetical protein
MTAADVAGLTAEVRQLREEVTTLQRVAGLFFEAGRADALGIPPRLPKPRRDSGHLRPVPG